MNKIKNTEQHAHIAHHKTIILSVKDLPRTLIIQETGKQYVLISTQNNKVMLQAAK